MNALLCALPINGQDGKIASACCDYDKVYRA